MGLSRSRLQTECPVCGSAVSPLQRYCTHCGADVNPPARQSTFVALPLARRFRRYARPLLAFLLLWLCAFGTIGVSGVSRIAAGLAASDGPAIALDTRPATPPTIATPTQPPGPTAELLFEPTDEPAPPTLTQTPRPTRTPRPTPSAPTSIPQPLSPTPTLSVIENGLIVFDSTRDGGPEGPPEIYLMNADGSNQRQLTNSSDYDDEPDLSTDGQWIAYESKASDNTWRIVVMRSDGSSARVLVEGGRQPAWSPDGRYLAYETTGFPQQIWIMDVASESIWQLTHNDRDSRAPSWSPDGRQIVFMSRIDGFWQLFTINVDTGAEQQFTFSSIHKRFPAWSPTENLIAYSTAFDNQPMPGDVWVIEPSGDNAKQLTTTGGNGRVAWSPDGAYLLYNTRYDDRWVIARINRDGTGFIRLTTIGDDQRADWERR